MKRGISLISLICIIIVLLVIMSAVMMIYQENNPLTGAQEIKLQSDMQMMLDARNEKYRDLLAEHFGEESKIEDADLASVVPQEYVALGFRATKTGLVYVGNNPEIQKRAKKMGIMVKE